MTWVAYRYLETERVVQQVARPAGLVVQVDCRGGAQFPGRLDHYHHVDHLLSARVVDDRTWDALPRPGRMWVASPDLADRDVDFPHPGGYQAKMPEMDQHDPVDRGRSAGIVKFLKAVLQNPAWPRPLAERPRVLAKVAERPVLGQLA